ncbi:MAG: hypothetical protein WC716_06665 [Chitinophagaceae bacterium]|jgi:hypothetical protein
MEETESIFNLFYYVNFEGIIKEVGVVVHEMSGSDNEKTAFLQQNVESDFLRAIRFPIPDNIKIKKNNIISVGIDHDTYRQHSGKGHDILIFENIFNYYKNSATPLMVITPVKNGMIHIEGTAENVQTQTPFPSHIHVDKQDDWFVGYCDQEGFHFDQLINDDFFAAIKILFNAKHYVSAMKLMLICIDTISYLEFGDVPGNFIKWLSTFADLNKIDITPEELWEFRNSILHMTNLDSRKVTSNKVTRLHFYVASPNFDAIKKSDEGKHFNFKSLIDIIAVAIMKWATTFNIEEGKIEEFVRRYDRVISDQRMTIIHHKN